MPRGLQRVSVDDFSAVPDAPQTTDLALIEALAADLRGIDYTVDGVAGLLGEEAYAALNREQTVPAVLQTRNALAAGDPLAVAVHLWLLGRCVTAEQAELGFPRSGSAGLLALGLVENDGDCYRAVVDLRPHWADDGGTPEAGNLWVASDLGATQRPGVLRRDHVLGIGQASLTLARLTDRSPARRALDLGTGCGIQTFHLLRHCEHVIATDVSGRALAFTRFNLLLNAAALDVDPRAVEKRVDLRLGHLLEPVRGERFDLIVSNPPFVITPRRADDNAAERYTYRDGGLPGDRIVSLLIADLPDHLRPGATAQLLGNWEIHAGDQAWSTRMEAWVPADTDAWVIQRERSTPAEYAETWLRDAAESRDPDLYEQAYAAYLSDFADRSVDAVGFGMVWLRRPERNQAFRRFEEINHAIEQPIGPHLADAVERNDWLVAHAADLEAQHVVFADDVTEERHQRPGAEHPGVILLRQGAGFRRTVLLTTELAGFVSACDGDLSIGQIIGALAALLDRPDDDFRETLTAGIASLIVDGFLWPAESGTTP